MAKVAGNSYSPYLYLPRQPPTLPTDSVIVTSPIVGVQFLDTSRKDTVHVIQTFGEPFMLPEPVRLFLRVHTIEVRRDPAVLACR